MDLTAALRAFGSGRPHALVVAPPGATAARLAVEAELHFRGWPAAASPAEADLLLVCGAEAPLAPYVERVWLSMGVPRARVQVASAAEAAEALTRAQRQLARAPVRSPEAEDRAGLDSHGGHGGRESDGGHGGHEGGEEDVAGLPLADRADDRDGLELDRLHVPLGPILADWPAGLVVHAELQGDVIQTAEVEVLAGEASEPPFWNEPWLRSEQGDTVLRGEAERRRAAAYLDSLGRLLAVAGWEDAALGARRLRDAALAGAPAAELLGSAERFARRVGRSRTLRWSTDSLGVVDRDSAQAAGVAGAAGDVTARWQRWLTETVAALGLLDDGTPLCTEDLEGPRGPLGVAEPPSAALLSLLPGLLEGAELGGARLIVASVDPDLDEVAWSRARKEALV